MILCYHVRQVGRFAVVSGLAEFGPGGVLPCATPGCEAGTPGNSMIVPEFIGHPGRVAPRRVLVEYERVTTSDGWRWSLAGAKEFEPRQVSP